MIASRRPRCLMSQSRLPGSEFSLTRPWCDAPLCDGLWSDGTAEAPDVTLPVPADEQAAVAAGIAAAPAAMPIKDRRENPEDVLIAT
jgi:hypothetical protein